MRNVEHLTKRIDALIECDSNLSNALHYIEEAEGLVEHLNFEGVEKSLRKKIAKVNRELELMKALIEIEKGW